MKNNIYQGDAVNWANSYTGEPYHALFCDAPYHLTTITKRFGKENSAPAQHGEDGIYGRFSTGFMGEEWDGGDVAFRPETWQAFKKVLYPGAFGMTYAGCRTYHRMATAIEEAGFIIHPTIAYITGQGFPKATRVDNQLENEQEKERWSGYRYGLQALKPAMEMICVFQKPYDEDKRPVDQIVETGAGAIWIDGGRLACDENSGEDSRWPSNVLFLHTPECKLVGFKKDGYIINRFDDGAKPWGKGAGHDFTSVAVEGYKPVWECAEHCSLELLEGDQKDYFYQGGWVYEQFKYDKKPSEAEKVAGTAPDKYAHPSYKPISLNKHLAKLLLPPEKYEPRLFVPFSGVASEMIGAMLAGWYQVDGVEIDLKDEYIPIANERLTFWQKWAKKGYSDPAKILQASQKEQELQEKGLEQTSLF